MKRGLLFLIATMVLFAGCSYVSNIPGLSGPGQEKVVPRGIGISFVEGFPPATITEGRGFNVRLNVVNYNPKEVSVDVILSDSVGDSFGGIEDEGMPDSLPLEGSGGESEGYDKGTVLFKVHSYNSVEEGMSTDFIATAEYRYEYDSIASLCINGFTSAQQLARRCQDKETIMGNTLCQSTKLCDAVTSPVAVTKIEKSSAVTEEGTVDITLDITIADVGGGVVGDEGKIDSIEVRSNDFNFKCDDDEITFRNQKEKTISCFGTGEMKSEYLRSPLEISYDYTYRITNSYGPVTINKLDKKGQVVGEY